MLKQLALTVLQKIVSPHTESVKLQEVTGVYLFKKQKHETGAKLELIITPVLRFSLT